MPFRSQVHIFASNSCTKQQVTSTFLLCNELEHSDLLLNFTQWRYRRGRKIEVAGTFYGLQCRCTCGVTIDWFRKCIIWFFTFSNYSSTWLSGSPRCSWHRPPSLMHILNPNRCFHFQSTRSRVSHCWINRPKCWQWDPFFPFWTFFNLTYHLFYYIRKRIFVLQ